MPLYTRAQLKLVLLLTGTLLVGLAVREWRAGFPDLAERLERFDRHEPVAPITAAPRADAVTPRRPPKLAASATRSTPEAGPEMGRQQTPAAGDAPQRLDLNRATAAELARLPGIGPVLADRITAERERRGRFESPEALRAVVGVGPKKLAAIRDLLTVEP